MGDSIAKGIGEQLGDLGKHIVTEVVKTPVKIAGINETKGDATGGSQKQSGQQVKNQTGNSQDKFQQEEITKQQQLVRARQMLQQFIQPQQQETSVHEQQLAEMEQRKDMLKQQQKLAAKTELRPSSSRPKQGQMAKKQSGSETKINIKAQ